MDLPPATQPCGIATEVRPWRSSEQPSPAVVTIPVEASPAGAFRPAVADDYRHALKPTPAGWPRRQHWCVWVEPITDHGPTGIWQERWHRAVLAALATWQRQLPITLVDDPNQAQVLVQRRRPPIQHKRASHGRALLQLMEVRRGGPSQLEPRVEVLISPGQGPTGIQATALHELGHAFGLWGHSDQAGDAMAAQPGAKPVLELSRRDRATLQWLQGQPGLVQP